MFTTVLLLMGMVSCVRVGEVIYEDKTIELDAAEEVDAVLKMNAGELRLEGGSTHLMDAEFITNVERWRPVVEYELLGKRGILKIRQGKSSRIPVGNSENRWTVRFNEEVPLSLTLDFGAGEGDLDLRGVHLLSLDIDMGVGDLSLDLSGVRTADIPVTIDGGVGSAVLYLPRNMDIRVRVDGGLGSVDADGFLKSDGVYTYDAPGRESSRLDIKVDAGIGSIELKLK